MFFFSLFQDDEALDVWCRDDPVVFDLKTKIRYKWNPKPSIEISHLSHNTLFDLLFSLFEKGFFGRNFSKHVAANNLQLRHWLFVAGVTPRRQLRRQRFVWIVRRRDWHCRRRSFDRLFFHCQFQFLNLASFTIK